MIILSNELMKRYDAKKYGNDTMIENYL